MNREYLVEIIRRANEFVKYSSEFWPSELKREIDAILESKEMIGAKFDREYAKRCIGPGWSGVVQEMAEEAKLNATLLFNKEGLEHFAELIVLECANIVYTAVEHREPASTYVSKILEAKQ